MTPLPALYWPQRARADTDVRKEAGWPASDCPGCNTRPQPGQPVRYLPRAYPGKPTGRGDIWPWHVGCASGMCPYCATEHAAPYDGGCLL